MGAFIFWKPKKQTSGSIKKKRPDVLETSHRKESLKKDFENPSKEISLKKSIDGSWEQLKLEEPIFYKDIENFKKGFSKDLSEFFNDIPKGVSFSEFETRETSTTNIIILKYELEGIPYPGRKVFFFNKKNDNLGDLFQINNDVPILKEINRCNNFSKEQAVQMVKSFSKKPVKNIKLQKKYFPYSGQQAILGYEISYDIKESFLIVINACDGKIMKGPILTRQH